jgi:hypothetical protein
MKNHELMGRERVAERYMGKRGRKKNFAFGEWKDVEEKR